MAQAMEKGRVIELLEYYKDIDGEVSIYRKIINDLTDQYYNPIGAIQCDGLPKGKNNISRQTENMALNIPDFVSGEIKDYEAKVQQLQSLKAQLLQEIEKIEGLERIRFMTSHPKDLSDELIEVMKNSRKICNHLHLPLQSGSSRILKIMNRHYDKEHYLELVDKIRAAVPDSALTTDIIVGFPGETEEDFEETMDVVRRVRYDSAFTFIYSKRTGTPAATMDDQIPEEVIKERFDRLLHEVQTISAEKAGKLTGQTLPVLVEEVNGQDASLVTGKLTNNSTVHFPGTADMIGTIQNVVLEECKGFYYIGRLA